MTLLKLIFGKKNIKKVEEQTKSNIILPEDILTFEDKIKKMDESKNEDSWNSLDFYPNVFINHKEGRHLYLIEWRGNDRKVYQLSDRPVKSFNIELVNIDGKVINNLKVIYEN